MDVAGRLGACGLDAGVHPSGLEVAADRAGRDFAKSPLPRQPDLEVVGLLRGEADVARAQRDDPIVQPEPFEDFFGACCHALVLVARLFRRRDRNQLDLPELVLADHAARVLARRARLRAKRQGPGGEAQRQGFFVDDALAHEIGQRNFGGGDEPELGCSTERYPAKSPGVLAACGVARFSSPQSASPTANSFNCP